VIRGCYSPQAASQISGIPTIGSDRFLWAYLDAWKFVYHGHDMLKEGYLKVSCDLTPLYSMLIALTFCCWWTVQRKRIQGSNTCHFQPMARRREWREND
jgi:hypothetical protein